MIRTIYESYKDSENYKELVNKLRELSKKTRELELVEPEKVSDEEMRKACNISQEEWKDMSKSEKEIMFDIFTNGTSEYDEWFEQLQKLKKQASELRNQIEKLRDIEFNKQGGNSYKNILPRKASKSFYNGFQLDTGEYHQDYLENLNYAKSKGYQDCYISEMTPDEYMDRCSKEIFSVPVEDTYDSMEDPSKAHEYAQMMKDGTKFYMPYLDVKNKQQEGRHRALAAKELGIKIIPVLYLY